MILDETQLKDALKLALIELLEERSGLLRDVLAEVMEDVALAQAIQEGETSETVSRDDVIRALATARLEAACALLDPAEERAIAEEGLGDDKFDAGSRY